MRQRAARSCSCPLSGVIAVMGCMQTRTRSVANNPKRTLILAMIVAHAAPCRSSLAAAREQQDVTIGQRHASSIIDQL
jgi:hypothetical protein